MGRTPQQGGKGKRSAEGGGSAAGEEPSPWSCRSGKGGWEVHSLGWCSRGGGLAGSWRWRGWAVGRVCAARNAGAFAGDEVAGDGGRYRERPGRGGRSLLAEADRRISRASAERYWKRDFSSSQAYQASVEPNRKGCAHSGGAGSAGALWKAQLQAEMTDRAGGLAFEGGHRVATVRWSAFGDVTGEGIELEAEFGLAGVPLAGDRDSRRGPDARAACRSGRRRAGRIAGGRGWRKADITCIVPALIDRTVAARNGRAKLTNREFIYRSAFELGRHVIGYEVQKVLALVDCFRRETTRRSGQGRRLRLRRRGPDRALRRGARPADRRGLRQRLFRRSQRCLAAAGRPQCLRAARAVRRCRGRAPDRAASADGRGGSKGPEFVIPPGTGGAPGG